MADPRVPSETLQEFLSGSRACLTLVESDTVVSELLELRAQLAQAEPVAWVNFDRRPPDLHLKPTPGFIPLYAAPPQAEHDRLAQTAQEKLGAEAADTLIKAQAKHAPMHSLHEGYAVILEELDELWDEVRAWQPGSDLTKARKEALHVAAMGLRLVHDVCDQLAAPESEGKP